jgi:hypothetical protein
MKRTRDRDALRSMHAIRETLDRAYAAKLKRGQLATVSAVVYLVGTYWRVSDRVSLGQIAALVYAIDVEQVSGWQRKRVGVWLRELRDLGVLADYEAGRGPGALHVVTLAERDALTAPDLEQKGAPSAPDWNATGDLTSRERGALPVRMGTTPSRHTVKVSDKNSVKDDEASKEEYSPQVVRQADRYIAASPALDRKRGAVLDEVARLHEVHAAFKVDEMIGQAIEAGPTNPLAYLKAMS